MIFFEAMRRLAARRYCFVEAIAQPPPTSIRLVSDPPDLIAADNVEKLYTEEE